MKILINCSNLKTGGGLQVANSICCQLYRFQQHHFIVVLSSSLDNTKEKICNQNNIDVYTYNITNHPSTLLRGRDRFLDNLVKNNNIDAVLTIFGPSRWCPRVVHLSGFAIPHLVIPESPYFKRMGMKESLKWKIFVAIRKWSFARCANYYWTENPYISKRLAQLFPKKKIYTVSNYYHQVFDDHSSTWKRDINLPPFDGTTCITVSSYWPHKNLEIIIDIIRELRQTHPFFKIRFVLTITNQQMPIPEDVKSNIIYIGKVDVSSCPYLYEQCDIMFQPSLLECFSATYAEAMRMEKPIVTTDMEFAHGLCNNAACYYNATSAHAAAEAIYSVASNNNYCHDLIENGKRQLSNFDNYEERANKLISIIESIISNR